MKKSSTTKKSKAQAIALSHVYYPNFENAYVEDFFLDESFFVKDSVFPVHVMVLDFFSLNSTGRNEDLA